MSQTTGNMPSMPQMPPSTDWSGAQATMSQGAMPQGAPMGEGGVPPAGMPMPQGAPGAAAPGFPAPAQASLLARLIERVAARDTGYARQPRLSSFYRFWKPPLTAGIAVLLFLAMWYALLAVLMATGVTDMGFVRGIADGTLSDAETFLSLRGALLVVGGIGLMLPAIALATHVTRERPVGTVSSVEGGLRPAPLLLSMAVALAVAVPVNVIEWLLAGSPAVSPAPVAPWAIAALVVALPLQCLAEEYVFRGHLMQTLASWLPARLVPAAVVAQAIPFMLLHPYDAYGMAAVLSMGIALGWVATRTGGLEVSGGIHIANNAVAFSQIALGIGGAASLGGAGRILDIILPVAMAVAAVLVTERAMPNMLAARREIGHQPGRLFPSQADALMWERIQEQQMAEWRALGEEPLVSQDALGQVADAPLGTPEPISAVGDSVQGTPVDSPQPAAMPVAEPPAPVPGMPAPPAESGPGNLQRRGASHGEPVIEVVAPEVPSAEGGDGALHESHAMPGEEAQASRATMQVTADPNETSPAMLGIMLDLLGEGDGEAPVPASEVATESAAPADDVTDPWSTGAIAIPKDMMTKQTNTEDHR